jgi:isopenicillin N synthase-like dioxygenase
MQSVDAPLGLQPRGALAEVPADLARHGFAILKSPLPYFDDLSRVYDLASEFFSQPNDWKRQFRKLDRLDQPRGHTYFGPPGALSDFRAERKESWNCGAPPSDAIDAETPWPEEMPSFRESLERLHETMVALAGAVVAQCEEWLKRPPASLGRLLSRNGSFLRVLRYPAVPASLVGPQIERTSAHEDTSLLTVMACPTADGLEIRDPVTGWITVHASPGQMIVNVGELLSHVTNAALPSVAHRVRTSTGQERMSIALFAMPERSARIPRYGASATAIGDYTAGDYLDERLPKLPRY